MTEKEIDMDKLKWCLNHITKLVELKAPKNVLANAIVRVLLPKLMRVTSTTEECMNELVGYMTRAVCIYNSTCYMCKKANAITDDSLCKSCQQQVDEMTREFEQYADEEDNDTV